MIDRENNRFAVKYLWPYLAVILTFAIVFTLNAVSLPPKGNWVENVRVANTDTVPNALNDSFFQEAKLGDPQGEGAALTIFRLGISLPDEAAESLGLFAIHWMNSRAFCGETELQRTTRAPSKAGRQYKTPVVYELVKECISGSGQAVVDIYVFTPNPEEPKSLLFVSGGQLDDLERALNAHRVLTWDLVLLSTGACAILLLLSLGWNPKHVIRDPGDWFKPLVAMALIYNVYVIWLIDLMSTDMILTIGIALGFLYSGMASAFNIAWTNGARTYRTWLVSAAVCLAVLSAISFLIFGHESLPLLVPIQRFWMIFILIDIFIRAGRHFFWSSDGNTWQAPIFLLTTLLLGLDIYTSAAEHRTFLMALYPLLIFGSIAVAVSSGSANLLTHTLQTNKVIKDDLRQYKEKLDELFEKQRKQEVAQGARSERQKMVRELHDGLGAGIWSLQRRSKDADIAKEELAAELQQLLDELRLLIQVSDTVGGSPAMAIGGARNFVEKLCNAAGFDLIWDIEDVDAHIPQSSDVSLHLLRIVREGVTNAVKHSEGSQVRVSLGLNKKQRVELSIEDDGKGLSHVSEGTGTGLVSMRERSEILRAAYEIAPSALGGNRISVTLPLAGASLQHP